MVDTIPYTDNSLVTGGFKIYATNDSQCIDDHEIIDWIGISIRE